ncbi:hypothetical protein [Actinacidiphila oryziradicis]|uniref:Uncharacterized protein n=1 Tax=Actinacidiphila oryziradicis TaxID=2571141 RepID=A0A4U0S8K0_9ACTN|nr:hypothetical protein [Actinacidiphila oryziradicis]TKA04758.1 hypothetical protein FCI23_34425 [Actinacidiphila oryziradicis]
MKPGEPVTPAPRPGGGPALRRRFGGQSPLACVEVGEALLIYPAGRLDPQAQALAGGVARDPEHTVVVLDLPLDAPAEWWTSVVRLLKRQNEGLRLIFGRQHGNTSPAIAQMLADRLRRPLLAPDGPVTPTAGGVLFVPTDRGAGWLTFRPGVPPRRESRRFPKPRWEPDEENGPWYTSEVSVAEALPAGVWARPMGDDPHDHRQRLVGGLLFRAELLTIVLGCPGAPALPLKEVARLWDALQPAARNAVRFVQYGPVAVPEASGGLGQELADLLRVPVRLCTGLPTGRAGDHSADMYTICEDGSPGWRPFAREFGHVPRPEGGGAAPAAAAPPEIVSHRRPLPGIPETMRGVYQYIYQYAPGAVLEVVRSGLWMRPPEDHGDIGAVRSAPMDPAVPVIWYDAGSRETEQRMRRLAEEARQHLDPLTREVCRVLPAVSGASAAGALSPRALPPAARPARPETPAAAEVRAPARRPGPGPATPDAPAAALRSPVHVAAHSGLGGQVSRHAATALTAVPAQVAEPLPDPHRAIWQAAQAGRHTEAAAMVAAMEEHALRTAGPDSPETRHWLEIRADLARRADDYVRATELCIAVAHALLRHHGPDTPEAGTAVDNAHHCWERVTDPVEFRRIAPDLIALRQAVPGPDDRFLRAARRRLEQLDTRTASSSPVARRA